MMGPPSCSPSSSSSSSSSPLTDRSRSALSSSSSSSSSPPSLPFAYFLSSSSSADGTDEARTCVKGEAPGAPGKETRHAAPEGEGAGKTRRPITWKPLGSIPSWPGMTRRVHLSDDRLHILFHSEARVPVEHMTHSWMQLCGACPPSPSALALRLANGSVRFAAKCEDVMGQGPLYVECIETHYDLVEDDRRLDGPPSAQWDPTRYVFVPAGTTRYFAVVPRPRWCRSLEVAVAGMPGLFLACPIIDGTTVFEAVDSGDRDGDQGGRTSNKRRLLPGRLRVAFADMAATAFRLAARDPPSPIGSYPRPDPTAKK